MPVYVIKGKRNGSGMPPVQGNVYEHAWERR